MNKALLILTILSLLGAGCANKDFVLGDEEIKSALAKTANEEEWQPDIVSRPPGEENSYGNSFFIYGPYQEKIGELDTERDVLEVIKFETPSHAERAYKEDDCLKGRGKPFTIAGITACCLNDAAKKISKAIMMKENYIFRSYNYFYADCKAVLYLKSFWKNYLQK